MISEILAPQLRRLGVEYTDAQLETLEKFSTLLLEKNAVMNLTAITEPREVALLHFADSGVPTLFAPEGASVIDVGTGGGFPGVPMAVLRPDLRVTLFDSLQKRIDFLSESCEMLGIDCACVHGRAEEAGQGAMRESFDLCVSRAVARLDMLSELCLPLVRVGGAFIAMKSAHAEEELAAAEETVKALGGEVEKSYDYDLGESVHRLYVIRKVSPTPEKYPRRWAKIKKSYG